MSYNPIFWENKPSQKTPISAENLRHMDEGILEAHRLIVGLSTRLNALADSDDTTLDQMSEIVAYIKSNKTLIDSITTSKVNVSDIIDNLTTSLSNKPLSAKQGVALKTMIDNIIVPTMLSQLLEDSTHRLVTDAEKTAWNGKSNFSGSYNDLTNKPTIPTKTSQLTNDSDFAKQTDVDSLSDEIDDLIVTDYVKAEAESVISRVVEAQGTRTFNMAVMTDLHNNGGVSDVQILHACQGTGYIADRIKLDVFSCLGDHTDSTGVADWSECLADILACNNHKHGLIKNTDVLELMGNHDYKSPRSPMTFKLISAYSKDVVWGDRLGGYFYKDYEDYKLRIIGLNTSETSGIGASVDQYNWFIETLDLSSKEDASEWQTLIISHVPLDYAFTIFTYILQAYVNGTSWSNGSSISCDFTGKNQATIIANVHGHIHNFLVDKMYVGNAFESTEQFNLYRIAIPEVTESYGNHYSAPFKHDVTYSKASGTSQDTSFNVLCIDLDNKVIKAINYGAGVDRTIEYTKFDEGDVPSTGYTNQIPISTDASGAIYNGVGYADGVRTGSDGADRTGAPTDATGFIPCVKGDTLYFANCQIDTTGNSTYQEIAIYGDGKAYIGKISASALSSGIEIDSNNYLTMLDTSVFATTYDNMKFVRITGNYIGADSIITVNQPITDSSYTNLIDTVGATDDMRLSTGSGTLKAQTGYVTSGLIDLTSYSEPIIIRTKGVDFSGASYEALCTYNSDDSLATSGIIKTYVDSGYVTLDSDGNMTLNYSDLLANEKNSTLRIKVCGIGKASDFILTVNEEIS